MIEKTYPGLRDFPPKLTQLATRGTDLVAPWAIIRIDPALLSLEKKLQKPQVREQLEPGRHPAQSEEGMAIFFSSCPPDSQIECAYATSESCLTKWETRNKMFAWPHQKFMIHVDGSDVVMRFWLRKNVRTGRLAFSRKEVIDAREG